MKANKSKETVELGSHEDKLEQDFSCRGTGIVGIASL